VTAVVLVQNPHGGGVLALTEGEENDQIATWDSAKEAEAAAQDHRLVVAWGGFVIDLDALEVTTL
jgi:CHASE3 domain sensor protein